MIIDTLYSSAYQGFGFFCSLSMVLGGPGTVFSDIRHLEEIGIESGFLDSVAKGWLMQQRRTGSDNNPVKFQILDVILNHALSRVGAHELIFAGDSH
jgi:hypothetical protein